MQVLHIRAGHPSSCSAGAAESLIASMAAAAPGLEVSELDLAVLDIRAAGGSLASTRTRDAVAGPPVDVVGRLLGADRFVLSLPRATDATGGLDRLAGVLTGMDTRVARAADRRSGHRVSRRLVLVAEHGGPTDATRLPDLVARLSEAFARIDVTEVGLISGEACTDLDPGGPPAGRRPSAARRWPGRREERIVPAAS